MRLKVSAFLTLLLFIGAACAFAAPLQTGNNAGTATSTLMPVADEATPTPDVQVSVPAQPSLNPTTELREPIVLPISVYILDDESGHLSSSRTVEQLEEVYGKVNEIWAQAGISFEVQTISRVPVPPLYLEAIAVRDFPRFFQAARTELDIPNPSLLNGFYARDIGGPNGIAPSATRLFFVTDFPSVHHERVTSHEIGHILGLHHVLDDAGRLMAPGTNGMALSEEEIIVARYTAQGLLDRVR